MNQSGLDSKMQRVTRMWHICAGAIFSCVLAAEAAQRMELRNDRLSMVLGAAERGAIISLKPNSGEEIAAAQRDGILFALTFSRKSTPPGDRLTWTSRDAGSFTAEQQPQSLTLNYGDFTNSSLRVTCMAKVAAGDPHVRWRIDVQVPDELVLEAVRFPIVTLRTPLEGSGDDDAAVLGSTKGGVIRQLGALKNGKSISIGQPGNMAAQFGCYYAPRGGFFTAAFDGRGYPKNLIASRTKDGVEFSWSRACFASGTMAQDYDVAMTTFTGTDGSPTDWRDAADIYKTWALTQPWCATTYEKRADIPAWMKDGPAMVRFGREWLAKPERIEKWLAEYWRKRFASSPLITAYWGWEKIGSWVTPDYFPVFPNDEQFARLVANNRRLGYHAFPWPSGYHWTLTYRKRADGSFEWDDRKRFDEIARPHAVQTREGKSYSRTPSWLQGGDTSCMCGSDPWTHRWWNDDICIPLAKRGCEMIQVDQVVGGSFPACFNSEHPHPPGPGLWQTESFTRQLRTMYDTMKAVQPDAVVCFEEPNEWFNHLVGIQDYRDCESPHEWASVFNYLYHEYLPPFQSNPRGDDLVMAAHCLVDGQIPHLVPSGRDLAETVLVNGGFETQADAFHSSVGWSQVHEYKGKKWTGSATSDTTEKHGGDASLRLDNTNKSDSVQVSQNVPIAIDGLAAGKKYRLSAWLKTGQMARPNAIGFCFLAPGIKSVGRGGNLPFPATNAGWQKVSADFDVPAADAEVMRIMIDIEGPARAWVDDMTLEEIAPDGTAKTVVYSGDSHVARFMRRWVSLYHGEGRPWLEFGRMLHPPSLACSTNAYQARHRGASNTIVNTTRELPAVFHNAFRAPDGREAIVLANPTPASQHVVFTWRGRQQEFEIPPADSMLVPQSTEAK